MVRMLLFGDSGSAQRRTWQTPQMKGADRLRDQPRFHTKIFVVFRGKAIT
jgi:hypothetical protein